jgi:acetoacetate decarboxylase
MKIEDVRQHLTTPLTSPAYPPLLSRFTDREYLNIVYRTDADALRAVVPEPLQIDEPLVRFEVMKMGDVTGSGPYTECGQAIPVSFDGEQGRGQADLQLPDGEHKMTLALPGSTLPRQPISPPRAPTWWACSHGRVRGAAAVRPSAAALLR